MTRPTRPSADKTRKKILAAAKAQFMRHGFDATFIKDIAKAAKVNTNLIFHHFTNKETLWCTVKAAIVSVQKRKPTYNLSSASAYFKSILDFRFELYSQNPDLVRLMQWQQLTDKEAELIGNEPYSPNLWLEPIKTFQQQGEIRGDIDAEQILLFIIFSTHGPFLQRVIPLTPVQIQQYKDMIFAMCKNQFLAESNNA